ncbi:uncharacterized protein LOC130897258 [Diorhabda carinulata]|uniref:uncharacterized protein LOC130897258 n=1 Tax=Diorhabda carinulata TaxID=1163345 RepID=UPI0025A2FEC3|nr:uncharacterized protein LOC130897258 [Diorhabda carinulata]
MNFLFQNPQNSFPKQHNNNFLLSPETPSKTTFIDNKPQVNENNNQISPNGPEKTLKELWSKHKIKMSKTKMESTNNLDNNIKMTWDVDVEKNICVNVINQEKKEELPPEIKEVVPKTEQNTKDEKEESPSHHARRPPNAFLIFCKKHRPIVRDRFPNLENRGVTKILGEWWALLNNTEKMPYNDLAREYKDAFLSANPDFRWYKLPAPPLRTLTTRPLTVPKPHPSISSPSNPYTITSTLSEFTPGKLADESQLGGLTSLMNNFTSIPKTETENNNNVLKIEDKLEQKIVSPVSNISVSTPPKPIKKRFTEYYESNICVRNILNDEEQVQDSLHQAMDSVLPKRQSTSPDRNGLKDQRKPERMCKGKRYEMFMLEGKLLGNKRDTKLVHQKQPPKSDTPELVIIEKNEPPNLGNTIKRLAERTNIKIDFDSIDNVEPEIKRIRSISETSESGGKASPPNFNLDLRISNLPSLSYDEFLQRKRDSKKRKARSKSEGDLRRKMQKTNKETQLVGSKKRKNKQSITHLGNKTDTNLSNDLIGLATLAEVAANTEKINEKISE